MSQEITTTLKLTVTKGILSDALGSGVAIKTDMTASTPRAAGILQSIGTSNVMLKIPSDIATPGYLFVRNRDVSNYVELGPTSDGTTGGTLYPFIHLGPGEQALLPLAVAYTACCAKANTAACEVEWRIITR